MKKKNNNNQFPPHLYNYWIKNTMKDGMIIKKKNINNTDIVIKTDSNTSSKNTDDEDRKLFLRIVRKTIKKLFLILKRKLYL
jgi:hypothetical protein